MRWNFRWNNTHVAGGLDGDMLFLLIEPKFVSVVFARNTWIQAE